MKPRDSANDLQVASIVPPILTCLVGRHLSLPSDPLASYPLRQTAASLLKLIAKRYGKASSQLKPRLARTCLKYFLDPTKSLGAQYGGIVGLQAIGGVEVIRALIVPNLKEYESVLRDVMEDVNENKKKEADKVIGALLEALLALEGESIGAAAAMVNGHADDLKAPLEEKIGPLFAERVLALGRSKLIKAILDC